MSLQVANLSQQLANHLSEQIVKGILKPGERLPEAELAKELSVSTNSLREAFHLLEKRHLIEWKPRRGASVSEITEVQVKDLYDFLFLLLSELAGQVAEHWQEGDLDDLIEVLDRLRVFHEQNDLASAHQLAFEMVERIVTRFVHNRYWADDIRDLLPLLQRFSYMALIEETTEFGQTLTTFAQLLNNVLQHNREGATRVIRDYGKNQCLIVLRALAKRNAA